MSMATVRDSVRFWANSPPVYVFTDTEIDRFLALEAVTDDFGYHPAMTGWTPTYDVLKAAGRAWLWLAGLPANAPLSYTVGDVTVAVNTKYCNDRARELMGSSCATSTRRDEPYPERFRERYLDGRPRDES